MTINNITHSIDADGMYKNFKDTDALLIAVITALHSIINGDKSTEFNSDVHTAIKLYHDYLFDVPGRVDPVLHSLWRKFEPILKDNLKNKDTSEEERGMILSVASELESDRRRRREENKKQKGDSNDNYKSFGEYLENEKNSTNKDVNISDIAKIITANDLGRVFDSNDTKPKYNGLNSGNRKRGEDFYKDFIVKE